MNRSLRLAALGVVLAAVSIGWAVFPSSSKGVGAGSRIPWQGANWYLHGVNVPWYNFDCDFGCGTNGGVASAASQAGLRPQFAQLQQSGVHMLRWYVFMNDGWQVNRDASGPTSVNPNVYTDISAVHYRPWRYWQAMATAFEYELVDLSHLPEEKIRGDLMLQVAVHAMRVVTSPDPQARHRLPRRVAVHAAEIARHVDADVAVERGLAGMGCARAVLGHVVVVVATVRCAVAVEVVRAEHELALSEGGHRHRPFGESGKGAPPGSPEGSQDRIERPGR